MTETVLTDVTATADKILNRVLAGSRVDSTEQAAMGWNIRFRISDQAVSDILSAQVLKLEHSCDEFAKAGRSEPWTSDPDDVEALLRTVEGRAVHSVRVSDDGEFSFFWDDGAAFRICPADYSMDWQWQVTPDDGADAPSFSIVSVHNDKIWTRYPSALELRA